MSTAKWLKLFVLVVMVVIPALLCLPAVEVGAIPERNSQRDLRGARHDQFEHKIPAHQQECASCHKFPSPNWEKVRTGSDAFADITEYPQHDSCLKCHRPQFFTGSPPTICSICHINPGPSNSSRHPFPNPRELFDLSPKGREATSDFVVGFPHDKHIDIVSAHRRPETTFVKAGFVHLMARGEESCSVCHKTMAPQGDLPDEYLVKKPDKIGEGFWLKRGTFKSNPIGHATCFTCHSADSGMLPGPQNCADCHKLKPPQPTADFNEKLALAMGATEKAMLERWRLRDSSGTFRHEGLGHAGLSCSTCHNVLTMNTVEPLTKKIGIAVCSTCHATPTLDGGGVINYEIARRKKSSRFECAKCHVAFGKSPLPPSHAKALSEAGK